MSKGSLCNPERPGTSFAGRGVVYIKHGNVAKELKDILHSPGEHIDGPSTYLSQFLTLLEKSRTLILSFWHEDESFQSGELMAITVRKGHVAFKSLDKAVHALRELYYTLYHLLRFRPDIILCGHVGVPLWSSYVYTKLKSCFLVHARHGRVGGDTSVSGRIKSTIENYVIRRSDYVVCNGPHLRQQLLDIGIPETRLCMFRPSFRAFLAAAASSQGNVTDFTEGGRIHFICYVGRMVRNKGIFDLLEACKAILQGDSSLKLLYLGSGSDLEPLRLRISQSGLTEQVRCLGEVSNATAGAVITQSKFVVTPTRSSVSEGFCKAAVEALVLGKPVVAPTDKSFSSFIENGRNGLLFEQDSVESLGRSTHALLTDEKLYKRLVQGAKETGATLVDPPFTFAEAVKRAFAKDGTIDC